MREEEIKATFLATVLGRDIRYEYDQIPCTAQPIPKIYKGYPRYAVRLAVATGLTSYLPFWVQVRLALAALPRRVLGAVRGWFV